MATQKFSDLTATTTPNTESVFAIAHSGSNFKLTITDLAANLPAISATSLTTSGTITGTGGFIGNLTGNVTGTASAATLAASATALATGRTIGMTGDVTWTSASFDGSGNVTGTAAIGTGVIVNADVNASAAIAFSKMADLTASRLLVSDGSGDVSVSAVTSTEAGYLDGVSSAIQTQLDSKASSSYVPTTITVADESTDTTCFPLFATAATGDLGPKTASGLTFNSNTDVLSGTFAGNITGNVTGNTSGTSGSTTGNAATATVLETARNIGGVSFNGSANIDLPGVNATGNQNTSGSSASCSGNSATATLSTNVTVADESTDTTCFPLFVTAATGDLPPKSGSNLAFNSSSGILTATGFAGALTGNVTGNASGSAGSCTGNSATATTSTNVTVADESSDTTCFPLFTTAATGDLAPKSGSNLAFNSSSGILTATGFAGDITGDVTGNTSGSSGSCTGNSATATSAATLTTARNIGGVSFNGSANIDLPGVNAAGSQNTSGTAAGLSATLAVGSGGTGATSLTANGVIIGNGTSALTAVDLSTKGKILIGDGSGNPQALAVGTNDYVLTADSSEATGVKWAEAGGGGGGGGLAVLTAVNQYDSTSYYSSYSYTGFSSSYDNYLVLIHAIAQDGTGDINLQFLDDGSAVTDTGYRYAAYGKDSNGTDRILTGNDTTTLQLFDSCKAGDNNPVSGYMYFHNGRGGRWDSDSSDSEGNVKPSVQWQFGGKDSGNYHRVAQGSGHYDNVAANTLNGFKLTFTGGSGATKVNLTIYGIKRS